MTTCLYWDGVHVVTFDGKHYVMPGSETCEKVVVQHQPSLGGEILKVLSKDGEVMIQQGSKPKFLFAAFRTRLTLDQATFSRSDLPDGIQRRHPGNEVIVELDFGGTVELTRAGLLRVELKKGLAVSGLCGNMDGNVANDQPSADQDSVFPMGCSTFTSSTTSSCATADSATMEQAEQTCQFLLKDSPKYRGVFQECESKVDPASYYQLCKSSVCYQGEDRHCWWIEMYARECQEQLVSLPSWKEQTECCHHPPPASSQECDKEYGFDVFERPELDSDGVTVLYVSDVLKCHGMTAKVNFRAETAEPFDVRFYRPVKSTQLLLVGSETITPTSPGRAEVHLLGQATPIPYRRGDILAISSERSTISFTHGGPTSGDVVVVKNVDNPEIASVRPGTLARVYEPVKKREYSLSALLSCSCDGEPEGPPIACNDPLGMESGSIPDGALTASSSLPEHGAQEGRLDSNAALTFDATGGAWVAQVSDRDQWIEVQLPRPTTIVGVQTQGRGGDQNEEWVSSFDVRYRREGPVLQYINNADGIAQTFEGNSDKNTIKTNYFAQPVEAELIRIQPKTWNRRIALRFELLGCRDSNPCASNPCQNGGSCIHDEIRNTHVCRCPEAYSGQNCDEAIGTCLVYPASTIRTYDLRYYRFPGECEYVLSQTCAGDAQQNFSVSVTTIPSLKNSSHVPERREVKLTLGGKTYELRGDKELYVDGEKIRIPYITHDIQIILAGNRKPVMKTPFGLRVWWDGESSVRVEVPDHFQGKLCGLCGNFNGKGEDDLMERGGSLTASATEFGLSWAVSSDCKRCPLCDNEPVCSDASHAASQCAVLNDENGPFSGCLQATEREMLYIYCVTDVCAAPGDEILCETLDALDQECRSRSAAVSDVRDLFSSCVGTPLPGTTFEPCLLPCTPTCVAPRAEDNCDILTCVPGLACSPGLVFNGETCVRHDQCGCLDDGRQYEVGETFTKRGCNLLCTCQKDGKESCRQITCHEDATCGVHEGVYGCHCKDDFSGDGQECVAINNPVDTLECQDATVTLSCENGTIDILSVFYGQDGASSACQPTSPLAGETCSTEAAALSVQALCQGRRTCTFVAGMATFGEPCVGIAKYVRTEHHCSETVLAHSVPDQAVARGVEEGSTLNLRCPNGTVLIIEAVRYGRSSEDCFEATAEVIVKEACHGKVACQLPVTSEVFGRPCKESPSRLKVASKCTSQPVDPDIEVHPCNTQPCNNGHCIATNDKAGFRCCCHEGFTGQFCDRVEGHCRVFGGSQVITFDNDHYRFYGDCYYTLFKDCTEGAGKLPVEVRVKGQKFQGLMRISFVTEVQVLLGDRKVSLTHGKEYIVDGFLTELPFTVAHDNITLSVRRAGNTLVASTNRGISVQWDGKRHVVVSVAKGAYKPCGMCGNFDDNPDNDAQDQNGQQNQDPCVRRASYNQQAFEICSVLTDKNGPFSACHATVDPEPFFNACMQDQCSILPATDLVCADLEAYADTCLGQGIKLPNWRVATGCGFSCPPDMVYTSCSDGFVRHCGLDELETTCSNRCYEGCECRLGKVLSGRGQCVNPHECGCTMSHDQDRFYASPGMTITQYGCQKYCECSAGNTLECQDYRCSDQGTCGAGKDLRYGCHCMSGYSGNGHYCQKEVIEYPRMHAVVTEGQVMKLDCGDYMLDILDVGYGSLELVCEGEDEVCDALSSRAMVLEMCQGYQKCAIPACDRLFGDPCFTRRHYLSVYYTCRRHPAVKHPRLPYRKVICQDHPVMLNCRGGYINVLTASYGRSAGREICAHDNIADQSCHEPTSRAVVMKLCQGHEKCEIWANARTFPDPCPNTYKYLEVQYECLDSKLLYYTGA
ncbi:zonadhesin-like [Diadema antillarum]|uniref:zonadhesin-like n=1 Tax=Diadema antillarum TaxID=105358 RepID=UPI003A841ACA